MAEEGATIPPVEAPAPAAAPVTDAPAAASTETNGETTVTKEDEEIAGKVATTEVTAPTGEKTEVVDAPSAAAAEATPAAEKKEKRKSIGGANKLNKKKSMPVLRLDCQPGEFYWARLKGYPPWPAIICDEQMLPESLLMSRPVSARRPDGSLREDFENDGKNAKERTFPIMFLSTNEFSWLVNTGLTPLDPEECKNPKGKLSKALVDAYRLASEDHDMDYYKGLLKQWQEDERAIAEEARQNEAEAERRAQEKAEKKAEKAKKPRKSKGGDGDVDMEDADGTKSSKKRKKDAESDGEGTQPKKTPKVTKLNAPKTPNGDSTKKTTSKPKKKVTAPKDSDSERPEQTEEEKYKTREKQALYLRHRLQKGFLARDQSPQEAEMASMADFLTQLEEVKDLEPSIIRATKVHKVLKGIVKLDSIPKDDEYNFKKRSSALLDIWNKRMESDSTPAAETNGASKTEETPAAEPKENGAAKEETKTETEAKAEPAAEEKVAEKAPEEAAKPSIEEPTPAAVEEPKTAVPGAEAKDEDADVSMMTAPEVPAETS